MTSGFGQTLAVPLLGIVPTVVLDGQQFGDPSHARYRMMRRE
jgi:hypothetical protein